MFMVLHLRQDLFIDKRTRPVQINTEEVEFHSTATTAILRKIMEVQSKPDVLNKPVTELIDEAPLNAIIERAKVGGGELVNLMGTSAWYAPGAAAAQMAEAIIRDEKRIFPVCAHLTGQYGIDDLFLGVPVKLGKNGIEQIIELDLNADEKALLHQSAGAVREVVEAYKAMGL